MKNNEFYNNLEKSKSSGSNPQSGRLAALIFVLIVLCAHCALPESERGQVVAYVSEDQVFSEPILREFETETGIKVNAVFDTEETKSTGVLNRLVAEKNNPQADVFWANEPIRAEILKQQGISAPYISLSAAGIPDIFKDPQGHWTGFSARTRVLVVHQKVEIPPDSIQAFTDPHWRGQGVIANPLFGTTTTALAALFTSWGGERAKAFLQELKQNDIRLSSSNGESADLVAAGEFAFSLVDSDDAVSRMRQGRPIRMVHPDQGEDQIGCLVLPNAVVLIKGGGNPENGKRLIDYLLSKETERRLALSDAAQIPLHAGVESPPEMPSIEDLKTMQVDYAEVAGKMREIMPFLKEWVGY